MEAVCQVVHWSHNPVTSGPSSDGHSVAFCIWGRGGACTSPLPCARTCFVLHRPALEMHCKRAPGKPAEARACIFGPQCPSCGCGGVTRPRSIAHLMRGALACLLVWRLGELPECPSDLVTVADQEGRVQHRLAIAKGQSPWFWHSLFACAHS